MKGQVVSELRGSRHKGSVTFGLGPGFRVDVIMETLGQVEVKTKQ